MEITIRKVRRTDIDGMNRIFNDHMKMADSCLDIDPKDHDYRLSWLAEHDKSHPVFVGELEEKLVCWAAISRYSTEYPYDGVANLELCVDSDVGVPGLYESLLHFMEEQAVALGYYKLIASVFANNRAALYRYRTGGFRDVGVFRNHGYYKGKLVDMIYLERLLPVNREQLQAYYRKKYPFYEDFFSREEALQELQMLRNGMVRSEEDPNVWVPAAGGTHDQEDWGGATVRMAKNLPTLDELLEQRITAARAVLTSARRIHTEKPEPPEPPEQQPQASAAPGGPPTGREEEEMDEGEDADKRLDIFSPEL